MLTRDDRGNLIYLTVALLAVLVANLLLRPSTKYTGGVLVTYLSEPGSACSGVVVSDKAMVTAGHCALRTTFDNGMFRSSFVDGVTAHQGEHVTGGHVVYVDYSVDMAIVLGDFRAFQKAKVNFSQSLFQMHRDYRSCGHPRGQRAEYCVPIGSPITNNFMSFIFQQPIIAGMSGGPVFDERTGELVGLNTAIYAREAGGGAMFTPLTGFGDLIAAIEKDVHAAVTYPTARNRGEVVVRSLGTPNDEQRLARILERSQRHIQSLPFEQVTPTPSP